MKYSPNVYEAIFRMNYMTSSEQRGILCVVLFRICVNVKAPFLYHKEAYV